MADDWKKVSVVQDLTKIQREEEKALKDECTQLAAKLSEDDAKNWQYKVVGKRGSRKVLKVQIKPEEVNAVPITVRQMSHISDLALFFKGRFAM